MLEILKNVKNVGKMIHEKNVGGGTIMNFKKRFLAFCMLLSLSFIVPQVPIVDLPIDACQTVTVVQAKMKTTKTKVKKKTTKKRSKKVKKEAQVYVTETGECYHTHACGRGNFYKDSLSSAKSSGLRPCEKCY